MVYRKDSYPVKINEQMRGGDGTVKIESLLTKEELYEKGRLFAKITIGPGCSIGQHVHEGEMEAFYIAQGKALFDDNGTQIEAAAGDTTYTPSGAGHSIRNIGEEDLVLIALILFR